MYSKYTRREFGAYALGVGVVGSTVSSSSRVGAAQTEYEIDGAGVPRPATTDELQRALDESPDDGLVALDPDVEYRADSTVTVPETMSIEGNRATVIAETDDVVFDLERQAQIYNVDIDLRDTGATAVRNVATANWKRPTGAYGLRVTADGGNGSRAIVHGLEGGNRNFYQNYTIETDGVDYPVLLKAYDATRRGFGTGNVFRIEASDFLTCVTVDSDTERCGFGNNHIHVDLSPSDRSERVLDFQDVWGKDFSTSGWIGDPNRYDDDPLVIRQTRKGDRGGHHLFSYEGYDDDGLIDNRTDAEDIYTVPFEVDREEYAAEMRATPPAVDTGTVVPVGESDPEGDLQRAADQGVLARVENGATLDPGIELPAGVVCDARGATMDGDGTSPMVSYNSGAILWGLTTTFDEGEVNGPVHSIRATGGERITGVTGPVNCFYEGKRGDPDAVPIEVLADGADSLVDGARCYVRGIDTIGGLDIVSRDGGTVRNCEFYGVCGQTLDGIQVLGDSTVEDCLIHTQIQPVADESDSEWFVDNPEAKRLGYEGILWDSFRLDKSDEWAGIWIENADGNVRRYSYGERDEDRGGLDSKYFNYIDDTNNDSNGIVPMATFGSGDREAKNVPAVRAEPTRFLRSAGMTTLSSDTPSRPTPTPEPEPEPGTEYDHELVVQGTGSLTRYEFAVTGELVGGDDIDPSGDGADTIDGSTASGGVDNRGTDTYRFDGEIVSFARDGDLDLFVDGQQVDPDGFDSSEPTRSVSIVGTGPRVEYELSVSGELEKSTARDGSINSSDEISESTASGYVLGGTDSYRFAGEITDLAIDDPDAVSIYLDGEEVDPARFGGSDSFELTISNRGYDEPATYQFTVTGKIEATASVNPNDEIDGSTGTGQVNGGADTYRYTGAITAFDSDGPLDVAIDGNTVYSSG
jgi:hypothetical protein